MPDNFRYSWGLLSAMALLLTVGPAAADHHATGETATAPTVLITGANRGLGLEFARQYAADGWRVIGTARTPGQADELNSLDVEVMQLDVIDSASVAALAADLDGRSLDMLINNAGIFPRVSRLEEVSMDDYIRTLNVNTVGPVRVTQALLPNLRQGDRKKIINITSGLGSIAGNTGGYYGYRESKAALNMLTATLAKELGPEGFTCLTIHPGWVATDMGGPSAPLQPPEAVSGMRSVIDQLKLEDNGSYKSYKGESVAW